LSAEFPEKDIKSRVRKNKRELNRFDKEIKIIESSESVKKDLNIGDKEIIPVLCHATPEPLSYDSIRKEYEVKSNIIFITPNKLRQLIESDIG